MRLAIDSQVYEDLSRNEAPEADLIEGARTIVVPFIVLAELRAGFMAGTRMLEKEQTLQKFLDSGGVEIIFADDETTHRFAAVYKQLRLQGTPMPVSNMWIAALVLQHDLVLLTRDHHFNRLPQLRRA